jgi:DNA-binding response OmpR family regulator
VSTAADGTTALAVLRGNRHEAVVLDVLMPSRAGSRCAARSGRAATTPRS